MESFQSPILKFLRRQHELNADGRRTLTTSSEEVIVQKWPLLFL